MERIDLVIVDDDINLAKYLSKYIKNNLNIKVKCLSKVKTAIQFIKKENPRIALVDIVFENDPLFKSGLEIIEKLSSLVDTDFVIITGSDSVEQVFRAGQLAVKEIITKSTDYYSLLKIIKNLLIKSKSHDLFDNSENLPKFIGVSEQMKLINKQIDIAASSNLPVLITGETGVGKDITARLIHLKGKRKSKQFRIFDAGSVEPSLVSKELFGNVKNAYTGAETSSPGIFKDSDQGTLFIDEIGDMSMEIQKFLLRALNKPQKIRPVGSSVEFEVDVRLILATNRNIKDYVENRKFRKDLYARIDNPLRINIPPLRNRQQDIPVLIDFFKKNREKDNKPIPLFSPKALEFLENIYSWPLNVREVDQFIGGMGDKFGSAGIIELDTVMESLQILKSEYFVDKIDQKSSKKFVLEIPQNSTLKQAKDNAEKNIVLSALRNNNFKISVTAEKLDISRTHLFRLMKKHSINKIEEKKI